MNDAMINFLGGSVILISAVAWLVRSLIVHRLNKDIDIFKNDLQHASKIEVHKLSLLHEKRAEVVAKLYQHLLEFVSLAHDFASPIGYVGEATKDEKGALYQEQEIKFRRYFLKNKIYFSRSICVAVDNIWSTTSDPISEFGYWRTADQRRKEKDINENEAWNKAWNTMKDKIPPLLELIEDEFRELLGVDNKKT